MVHVDHEIGEEYYRKYDFDLYCTLTFIFLQNLTEMSNQIITIWNSLLLFLWIIEFLPLLNQGFFDILPDSCSIY